MNDQRKRIHPHKFTLWVGIGSIVMMFAGLTSAYIVKRNLVNWITFDLPVIFWYSTAVIIASSITIMVSRNYFEEIQAVARHYHDPGYFLCCVANDGFYKFMERWFYIDQERIIFIFIYYCRPSCRTCYCRGNCFNNNVNKGI
jgi:hypothetical protein